MLNYEIKFGFMLRLRINHFAVDFNQNYTAEDLKSLYIESSFSISSNSYFLKLNSKILTDTDKIGLKKDPIIKVCFKLTGRMIDTSYSTPLHGLEVILLNFKNKPIFGSEIILNKTLKISQQN